MITAIITAHRKWHKLLSTLESISMCPNITDCIVVTTGFDRRATKALTPYLKKYKATLLDQGNAPSHIAWKAGADAVKTPAVILLHDGDVLSPEFSTTTWVSGIDNAYVFQARNITDHWVHKELCVEGFTTTQADIKRVVSAPNSKSLSPGRAVLRTSLLQSALERYNKEVFTHSLLYGESLAIGNDLTIWHYLSHLHTIRCINKPLIAFDTEDSTTARADAGISYKLEPYYNRVRRRLGLSPVVSKLNICYSPYNTPTGVTDFSHLNFPLPIHARRPNDAYGAASFFTALEYAWCMGYTWMQFFETDCRFPFGLQTYLDKVSVKDFQDRSPWGERMELNSHQIAIGTPTVWNAQGPGREYYKHWCYLKKCYEEQAHLSLQMHGDHTAQPALYVNGALGIYNVREVYALLMRDAKRDINSVTPWDLQLGYRIYDKYREDAPSRIGIDPYQYSDGDLIYLPLSARTNDNILAWHK